MLAEPEADDDDDTIEIELTADEMRGLSRAAAEAQSPTHGPPSRKRRIPLWPLGLAVPVIGIAAAIIWRPAAPHRVVQQPAPLAPVIVLPPAAPEPQAPPLQQAPPVRVRNPFDPTEVFEFPAGTTKAEARQKMSQLLLQRAVDRGDQLGRSRPVHRRRARNDDQPP